MTNWHLEVLPEETRQALETLAKASWLKDSPWYLAGGTALALSVGHRSSVDLDFFTPEGSFSIASMTERLSMPEWTMDILKDDTIYGRLHGAQVSFIAYPFFVPRAPKRQYGNVAVLAPEDPMPDIHFKTDWETVKQYFLREVPKAMKSLVL